MAMNSLGLGFVFTATDLASGKINQIARSFGGMDAKAIQASRSMQANFALLGAGAVALGVGIGSLMGSFALADMAGQFGQEVARAGAISGATAAELDLLREAAIKAGASSRFSPTEAIMGLTDLAQAGMNATESISALDGVMQFAGGGGVAVEQSAVAISSALRVFSLDASKAGLVADQFLRITNSTALGAADMEQAMGSVARGAIATKQSIKEMLPAIGLVKNTGVDVSVAAQSVSSALVFMSSRASEFKKLGVEVTDVHGNFRPFMDIILETTHALNRDFPNAAERAAKATELFSRFGLQAYTGISQQLTTGIRDMNGELLQGRDAVEYLRNEMAQAGGTAEDFMNRLNDTYEGRKALFMAASQTLGILVGEGFESALKPLIEGLTEVIRFITNLVREMPAELKKFIAGFILAAGAVMTLFGAFVAVKAIFALLAPFVGAMATAFSAVLASLGPLLLAFIAVGAVAYAFYRHISTSQNALASFRSRVEGVVLAFRGLFQLLGSGQLSGEVLRDLNKAEHSGIKRFIAVVYSLGYRVMQFFRSVKSGLDEAILYMGPTIERVTTTFQNLWGYVMNLFGGGADGMLSGGSSAWIEAGLAIGRGIGFIVEIVMNLIDAVGRFTTGFIGGFSEVIAACRPSFEFLMEQLGGLWDQIVSIGEVFGLTANKVGVSGSAFEQIGQVIGGALAGALSFVSFLLGGIVAIIRGLIAGFRWMIELGIELADVYVDFGISVWQVFKEVGFLIGDLIDNAHVKLGELMENIPENMRTESTTRAIMEGDAAKASIAARETQRIAMRAEADSMRNVVNMNGPSNAEQRRTDSRAAIDEAILARAATQSSREAPPIMSTVNLVVDQEVLASVTTSGNETSDARSFQTPRR